jgi:hypothetical protein
MNQDNPFAKLGAVEQKLYQETSSQQGDTKSQNSGNPENKKARHPDTQKTSIPEIQSSGSPESHTSRNPEIQNATKREFYTKVTYRICDEAVDALEDAKKHLKRQYKLKVNMEEIVETAIIEIYKDLTQKRENSVLVSKYSGNPENQNT